MLVRSKQGTERSGGRWTPLARKWDRSRQNLGDGRVSRSVTRERGPSLRGAEAGLDRPVSRDRVIDAAKEQLTSLNTPYDRLERRHVPVVVGIAQEDGVRSGRHRGDDGALGRIAVGYRPHAEVVGEDEAVEAELVTQQIPHNRAGQAGRCLAIERGHQHVRDHDRRHLFGDRRAKRRELDGAQPIGGMLDHGKVEMRVDARVAMAGEVLAARRDAVRLERPNDDRAQPRHLLRTLTERAVADHGILGIGMNVEDRRKIEGDPDGPQFDGERAGKILGEAIVAALPQRAHRGPFGEGTPQPRDASALLIDRHPQRRLTREPLQIVHELGHLLGRLDVAREQDDPADVELARERLQLRRHDRTVEAHHRELTDLTMKMTRHGNPLHYNVRVELASSAPTRIDLAGGTIDIWPLYLFHEGAQTLNVAISLRARAHVASRSDGRLAVHSRDTGQSADVGHWSELPTSGPLGLLCHLLRHFRAHNLTLTTRCDSPAGAGIAGSSALNVAVCAALARWTDRTHDPEELLEIAMNVEARAIGVPTGVQDYRPALYGGVSAVELHANGVQRVALDVPVEELERRLVLAYTGAPRHSGTNNWDITKRHIDGDAQVFRCFEEITDTALTMRQALDARDWDEVGRQIAREWETRKRLSAGVTTPAIESLMAAARSAGAQAAKVCGAGGGGCLFCYADPADVPWVRHALVDGGAQVLDFQIERDGLRVG